MQEKEFLKSHDQEIFFFFGGHYDVWWCICAFPHVLTMMIIADDEDDNLYSVDMSMLQQHAHCTFKKTKTKFCPTGMEHKGKQFKSCNTGVNGYCYQVQAKSYKVLKISTNLVYSEFILDGKQA